MPTRLPEQTPEPIGSGTGAVQRDLEDPGLGAEQALMEGGIHVPLGYESALRLGQGRVRLGLHGHSVRAGVCLRKAETRPDRPARSSAALPPPTSTRSCRSWLASTRMVGAVDVDAIIALEMGGALDDRRAFRRLDAVEGIGVKRAQAPKARA